MNKRKVGLYELVAAILFAVGTSPAVAQQTVKICNPLSSGSPAIHSCQDVSATNPLPITGAVTGTFSASLGGFTPSAAGARMTPLSVGLTDSSGALPTGAVTVVSNVGSNPMYCNVNGIAATTDDQRIEISSWFAFTVPAGVTTLHCIATGGTTTANGVGGDGLATGAGGGSAGGGSGGTVVQGNAGSVGQSWYVRETQGGALVSASNGFYVQPATGATFPMSVASLPLPSGASTSALQSTGNGSLSTIATNTTGIATAALQSTGNGTLGSILSALGNPFQVGGSIGNSGFNALQGGSANAVGNPFYVAPASGATFATSLASLPALASGSNIAGRFGIDQTTPGTTNNVTLSDASGNAAQVDAATHAIKADIVAGSVTASFSGYGPEGYVAPMSVTNVTSRTALPTNTGTVVVYNVGSNNAYVTIGNTSVNATLSDDVVYPNCWVSFAVGSAVDIAAITSASTTTLNLSGGAGLPTGGCAAVLTGASTVTANQGTAGATPWLVDGSSGTFPATQSGTWNLTNISGTVSLPTGAATAAKQDTGNSSLGTIVTNTTGIATAANQSTAIASLSSIVTNTTGAATAAKQDTGNSSLGTIATNTGNLATDAHLVSVISAPGTPQTESVTVQGNASGVAIPVSGTFWQATQPVSGTVTANAGTNLNTSLLATDAHLTALTTANHTDLGTINTTLGTPMQNSGGSVTANAGTNLNTSLLATDAHLTSFTSANHTDLGTIATNQTNVTGTKAAGTAAANSVLTGAVYNSTPLTLSNANQASLQADANGYLKVNVAAGAASGGTSSNFGSAFPTPGTAAGAEALASAPTWTNGNMAPLWVTTGGALVMDMVAGGNLATAMANGVTQDNHPFTQGTSYDISFGCLYATAYSAVGATGNLTVPQCDQYGRLLVTGAGANGSAVAGFPVLVAGSDGTNARNLSTDTSGRAKVDLFGNAGATLDVAAAGATSATNAIQIAGQYLSPQPTISSGQSAVLQVDANGNLKVNIQTGAGSGGTAITDNTAFTQSTTSETPIGCLYKSGYTNATSGNSTVVRCAADGGIFVTPDSASVWGVFSIGSASGSYGVQPAIGVNGNARNPTGLTPGTSQTGIIYAVNGDLTSVGGTAVLAGNGVTGAGSQRVTIASDNTAFQVKVLGNAGAAFDKVATSTAAANSVQIEGVASGTAVPVSLAANQSVNVAQVNGVTTLTGAGATGTGSQRNTVAQDVTTIAGSAPGTAGTASANVITVQGVTSMTPVAVNVASGGIASGGIASGAFASGSISANAAASGAFPDASLTQLGGMTTARSTATDTTSVGVIPLLKEISFMAQTPAALPANQSVNVAQVNGVTTLMGAGATGTGSQRVTVAGDTATIAGSAVGTAGTASTNVVTVQGISNGTALNSNVFQINGVSPLMGNGVTGTGSQRVTIASDNTAFSVNANTAQVNGVTTLTGAGATGTGSQRTTVAQDATTIAGSPPGRTYNTVAASQTAQALTGGSGGATGDYLSHCMVFPTSTSPGVVTILDNATTESAFPGGASSISNLVPFVIPVGAVSVSGAWKVTTGANVSVTCYGKFT